MVMMMVIIIIIIVIIIIIITPQIVKVPGVKNKKIKASLFLMLIICAMLSDVNPHYQT